MWLPSGLLQTAILPGRWIVIQQQRGRGIPDKELKLTRATRPHTHPAFCSLSYVYNSMPVKWVRKDPSRAQGVRKRSNHSCGWLRSQVCRTQREKDGKFKCSPGYRVSLRSTRATWGDPGLEHSVKRWVRMKPRDYVSLVFMDVKKKGKRIR